MDKFINTQAIQQAWRAARLFGATFVTTLWAGFPGTRAAVVASIISAVEVAYRAALTTKPTEGRKTNL